MTQNVTLEEVLKLTSLVSGLRVTTILRGVTDQARDARSAMMAVTRLHTIEHIGTLDSLLAFFGVAPDDAWACVRINHIEPWPTFETYADELNKMVVRLKAYRRRQRTLAALFKAWAADPNKPTWHYRAAPPPRSPFESAQERHLRSAVTETNTLVA